MMDERAGAMLLSVLFLLYGIIIGIWAFVDFIRILTGGLQPDDGMGYREDYPMVVQMGSTPPANAWLGSSTSASDAAARSTSAQPPMNDGIEKLQRLAKLREQGILTDEEFQQQKEKILKNL